MPVLFHVLDEFGDASGLEINTAKTVTIALRADGPQPHMVLPPELKYLAAADFCRYLGIQVGSRIDPSRTWTVATAQLEQRLLIAGSKSLTVDQRSLIAAAVILPKLLYISRHAWPTTAAVKAIDKRIKHYVWHSRCVEDITGVRTWANADVTALGT